MGERREDWNGVMELFPNQMEMIVIVVVVGVCVCVCVCMGGGFHKVRRF